MAARYACIADATPKYRRQAFVWALTLLELGGRSADELVVFAIEPDAEFEAALGALGVEVVPAAPFNSGFPLSYRIGALLDADLEGADHLVLCDCDLAFCADISDWVGGDGLRAKLVDHANPPLRIWRALFAEAGFATEPAPAAPTHGEGTTYANNFNGGLLIIARGLADALAKRWPRWYAWTLGHRYLLDRYAVHSFQISLGLTLEELGVAGEALPSALNFPTHLAYPSPFAADIEPLVLHYHDAVEPSGLLRKIGLERVDAAVERVNAMLSRDSAVTTPA